MTQRCFSHRHAGRAVAHVPGPKFQTVDAYIASFPPDVQRRLRQIRRAIRAAVPDAEERISYNVPSYHLHGHVVYFAGFAKHCSLLALSKSSLEAVKEQAARYSASGKGTIRFLHAEPLPLGLIGRLATLRARENREKYATKVGRRTVRASH
jgi:uncharacterized protein YdhG (YjbR/CyaY superfamily)